MFPDCVNHYMHFFEKIQLSVRTILKRKMNTYWWI